MIFLAPRGPIRSGFHYGCIYFRRKFLWVHVILAVSFLFLAIAVMRHFSRALKFVDEDPTVSRTVMIIGIAKKYCKEDKLRLHFQ